MGPDDPDPPDEAARRARVWAERLRKLEDAFARGLAEAPAPPFAWGGREPRASCPACGREGLVVARRRFVPGAPGAMGQREALRRCTACGHEEIEPR